MTTNQPINKHLRLQANCKLANIVRLTIDLASMLPEQIVKSCLTCDNFDEPSEICKKFNARPPAKVIAFGCEGYCNIEEEIPF